METLLKLISFIGIPTRKMIEPFLTKYLGSMLRHAMSGLGVWLVAKGITDGDTAREFLGLSYEVLLGVASYLIAQGFSLAEKMKRK